MKAPELHVNTWRGWMAFLAGLVLGSIAYSLVKDWLL